MKAVAEKKKTQNIGEYIIYMYQMEDLIRAYGFNLGEIDQYVIKHYPISDEEKSATLSWFDNLSVQMKKEKVTDKGHLKAVQEEVDELAKIHWELLKRDKNYFEIYQKAKPYIIELVLEAGPESPGHEIQICIHAVYGLLLSRLRGREIPAKILEATNTFGDVLSYLNYVYFDQKESKVREN